MPFRRGRFRSSSGAQNPDSVQTSHSLLRPHIVRLSEFLLLNLFQLVNDVR